jgi:hypothetical protein
MARNAMSASTGGTSSIVLRAKLLCDEAASPKTGFRFGWPLIRFGTDVTLKFSRGVSQYLVAIGTLRDAIVRWARDQRRLDAWRKNFAGAPGSARKFSRVVGVTRSDPPGLTAESAAHGFVVEFESHARRRSRDDESESDKHGLH